MWEIFSFYFSSPFILSTFVGLCAPFRMVLVIVYRYFCCSICCLMLYNYVPILCKCVYWSFIMRTPSISLFSSYSLLYRTFLLSYYFSVNTHTSTVCLCPPYKCSDILSSECGIGEERENGTDNDHHLCQCLSQWQPQNERFDTILSCQQISRVFTITKTKTSLHSMKTFGFVSPLAHIHFQSTIVFQFG